MQNVGFYCSQAFMVSSLLWWSPLDINTMYSTTRTMNLDSSEAMALSSSPPASASLDYWYYLPPLSLPPALSFISSTSSSSFSSSLYIFLYLSFPLPLYLLYSLSILPSASISPSLSPALPPHPYSLLSCLIDHSTS